MKVLWKSDLGQGKHDPLEVTHVVTKSGSQISAELVVPLGLEPIQPVSRAINDDLIVENAGLLEVIEAQMAAIDELTKQAEAAKRYADTHTLIEEGEQELAGLKEWADQFPVLVEELCMALGFARNPVGPTGIPELDRIVGLAR